ncbi:MAG: type II toxin-antitoxin system PemK/MazF family toxin [Candidatus Altimarinota bacterium]
MNQEVRQGEIWWIDPTPKMGREQRGRRPALVIQNDIANTYLDTTIIAIISSSGSVNMPEMVPLGKKEGLTTQSHADFAQIFTIDKQRLTKKAGKITTEKWEMVEKALRRIFLKTLH